MPDIQRVSMTALNRNPRVLHPALDGRGLVLVTQHGRAVLAVAHVELFAQLLTIAEQAAALLHQPDLRQLGRTLARFEDASLLADQAALVAQLADLARAIEGEQTS